MRPARDDFRAAPCLRFRHRPALQTFCKHTRRNRMGFTGTERHETSANLLTTKKCRDWRGLDGMPNPALIIRWLQVQVPQGPLARPSQIGSVFLTQRASCLVATHFPY